MIAKYEKRITVFVYVVCALIFTAKVQAGDPGDPVAHWAFEEGALQTVFNNANPGTYDGYRGRTISQESNFDALWTNGLNGSSYALWFTNSEIVTITEIADDINSDRVADSGPLSGSFSMFMRVNLPNADYQMLATADKGPTDPSTRGFYFDTQASALSGSTYHLGLRFSFNAPTNNNSYIAGGTSSDIAVTNVESIGFTFKADPDPSDASNDGTLQFYVNGTPFYAVKTHNAPYIGVSGHGFWLGKNFEVELAKGAIMDDVAIWNKVLTDSEMAFIETNALTQPDPGPGVKPDYPYAHWPFDEGSGEIVKDIRTRGVNDGYLGSSPSDTTRNPTWIAGLNGSDHALQYDNIDIVVIDDIANDNNSDRVADSGPFSGDFTLFARVDLPNTNRIPIYNADKEAPITDRGFYVDYYNCYDDGTNWHIGTRMYTASPTNALYKVKGGSVSTPLCTDVQTMIISFKADPNPGDSNRDGEYKIYINGELFDSATHNAPYVGVSGNNKFWLAHDTYNDGKPNGLIMDDMAIWDKVLTDNEIYYIEHSGIPIEPPAGTLILIN